MGMLDQAIDASEGAAMTLRDLQMAQDNDIHAMIGSPTYAPPPPTIEQQAAMAAAAPNPGMPSMPGNQLMPPGAAEPAVPPGPPTTLSPVGQVLEQGATVGMEPPAGAPPVAGADTQEAAVGGETGLPPAPGAQPLIGPGEVHAPKNYADAQQQYLSAHERYGALKMQHAKAAGEAAAAQAQRLADAEQETYRNQVAADMEYQRNRDVARASAARTVAEKMARYDAALKEQPDPGAYFTGDGGTLRRVMWMLSIGAQAIANRKHPERANAMMQLMRAEIDRDVALQKDGIAAKQKGLLTDLNMTREDAATKQADMKDDYFMVVTRLKSLAKVAEAKARQPGPEAMRAAYAQQAMELHADAMKVAESMLKTETDIRMKDVDFGHQKKLAYINQAGQDRRQEDAQRHSVYMEDLQHAHKKELAPIEAEIEVGKAAAKAKAEREAGMVAVPKATGLQLVGGRQTVMVPGPFGVPIPKQVDAPRDLRVTREVQKEVNGIVDAANEQYTAYSVVREELPKLSGIKDFAQLPPRLQGALMTITYATAKADNNGRAPTDADVKNALVKAVGGDYTGVGGRVLEGILGRSGDYKAYIDERMRDMLVSVPKQINGHLNAEDLRDGEQVMWSPPNMRGDAPETKDKHAMNITAGVKTDLRAEPTSVAELRERERQGTLQELSSAASSTLESFKEFAKGGTGAKSYSHPQDITERAAKAIEAVKSGRIDGKFIPEEEREAVIGRLKLEMSEAAYEADKRLSEAEEGVSARSDYIGSRKRTVMLDSYNDYVKELTREGLNLTPEAAYRSWNRARKNQGLEPGVRPGFAHANKED